MRSTTGDKVFRAAVYVYLIVSFLLVFYPILYIVSASFSDVTAVTSGRVWLWPVQFSLDAYTAVFQSRNLMTGYTNSALYAVVGTVISVSVTIMGAYPLSRKDLVGRGVVTTFFAITMWFSGGMIPTYLLIKNLGLINTFWVMVLPGVSVWNMILMRTYFTHNIPEELYESAALDGCRDGWFIVRVVLPLSTAIIAVIALYSVVGYWNSYFNALMYLTDYKRYPLQVFLRELLIMNQQDSDMLNVLSQSQVKMGLGQLLRFSTIVVSTAPVLLLYAFLQRFFVKGVMIGAIKG